MKHKTFLAGLILAGAVSFSGTAFAENNVTALKTAEIKSGGKLAVSANVRDSVNVMKIHDAHVDPKGHVPPPPPKPGYYPPKPRPVPPKPGHNPPDIHRPRPPKPDYHDYDYGRRPHPDEMGRPPKDYRPAPHMHMPPPKRDLHPEDKLPPPPHKDHRPTKP